MVLLRLDFYLIVFVVSFYSPFASFMRIQYSFMPNVFCFLAYIPFHTYLQTLFVYTRLGFESLCKQIPKHLNGMTISIVKQSESYRQYMFSRILDL